MIEKIEPFLVKEKFKWKKIESTIDDLQLISSVFKNEEFPIFEHSPYHLLSYLGFDHDLLYVSSNDFSLVLMVKPEKAVIFSPLISNFPNFLGFASKIKKLCGMQEVCVQNLSESWLNSFDTELKMTPHQLRARSKEEVVYDVNKLNELKGSCFAKLRNIKNKTLANNFLSFSAATGENLGDALRILSIWNTTQGTKYKKDKQPKEEFVLKSFIKFKEESLEDNVLFDIGYLNETPVSICIMHRSIIRKDWVITYLIKGINKISDGGAHGVSDATYLHCFEAAKRWNTSFINDGELGDEEGTRIHKLSFQPTMYLKSFDIFI